MGHIRACISWHGMTLWRVNCDLCMRENWIKRARAKIRFALNCPSRKWNARNLSELRYIELERNWWFQFRIKYALCLGQSLIFPLTYCRSNISPTLTLINNILCNTVSYGRYVIRSLKKNICHLVYLQPQALVFLLKRTQVSELFHQAFNKIYNVLLCKRSWSIIV